MTPKPAKLAGSPWEPGQQETRTPQTDPDGTCRRPLVGLHLTAHPFWIPIETRMIPARPLSGHSSLLPLALALVVMRFTFER